MSTVDSNAAHGKDFQAFIYEQLRGLKSDGYLTQVIKEFRAGEPGYGNTSQYYAPFLIQFNDRTRWILYSTTSMRTDRIKAPQWDSDHLKQIDATISKSFLVYPDEVIGDIRSEFIRQKQKYDRRWEFSRIDDIVPFGDLVQSIKRFDDEYQRESIVREGELLDLSISPSAVSAVTENQPSGTSETEIGRAWDLGGRNFERFVSNVLSSRELLSKWKSSATSSDFAYQAFSKILQCLAVKRDEVLAISATSDKDDIGLLPSGGSPKTDVIATVKTRSAGDKVFTFSCKRSSKSQVSAHQYSADAFADVLDQSNSQLRDLLRTFQIYGTKEKFPHDAAVALENLLADKLTPLCKWVVGGYGGGGDEKQLANYVVAFRVDKKTFSVHSTEEYVNMMLSSSKGAFGTPFSWTFASGQRGRSIQLKMPML